MVTEFLPSMRQLVSRVLKAQGLSQTRISTLLGVTQAAVSIYLSSVPSGAYESLAGLGLDRKEALNLAVALAEDAKKSPSEGVSRLYSAWTMLLGSGSVCASHREMHPSLADCDFCIKEYGGAKGTLSAAISDVSDAVRLLEASTTFARAMPEVSVNVACAAGEANSAADIVAIPGRITRVGDRARAMLPPEAGASMHMSRILLMVRKLRPDLRACINLRYDVRMRRALKELGLKHLILESPSPGSSEDPTAEALGRTLRQSPGPFDVIVDPGGRGIEPNIYVLSSNARGAAELAIDLSDRYSAG